MKFSAVVAVGVCALSAGVSAKDSSIDVKSVISEFYHSQTPTVKNAQQSTSLAKAIYSVQSTWDSSPQFTSAAAAIVSAAPSSLQASISSSGWYYDEITSQDWYTKSVPKSVQTEVSKYIAAENSAAMKVIGTPSTGTSKGAAAKQTAAPMIMGAMGVVGGVLAVL